MSTERQQSAINEVLDQISLDYADGEYLNRVTSNLGLDRPPLGFSDDSWRAIAKTLALRFKQIAQKFRDVLTVVFGPRTTVCGNVAAETPVGSYDLVLQNTDAFPDLGTVVIDQGLASEETITYCFIERGDHTIKLDSPTTFVHSPAEDAAEVALFAPQAGDTSLYLYDSQQFPTVFPASILVGRGTSAEEVVAVTANNTDTGVLTISPALTNTHLAPAPTPIQSSLLVAYTPSSEFLLLTDTSKFPATGYIRLAATAATVAATGGTTSSSTSLPATFSPDRHVGSVVVFTGNITAALADLEAEVVANTGNTLTFRDVLPAAVAAGDTFSIRPTLRFTDNDYLNNSLQLTRDIADIGVPVLTEVELLEAPANVEACGAKVGGAGWDVIQVTPRLVELLIPAAIGDANTTRSAGYLHPPTQTASTTTTAPISIGDTTVAVTASTSLPPAGALEINGGAEYIGYTKVYLTSSFVTAGSTTTTINVADALFATVPIGYTVYIEDTRAKVSLSRVITARTATSLSFEDPLENSVLASLTEDFSVIRVESEVELALTALATAAHAAAVTVAYYEEPYAGATDLAEGNPISLPNTWPGPYLYDLVSPAPASAAYLSSLSEVLAGPTALAVDVVTGFTAVEVTDASHFPLGAVSPFTALLGRLSANRERLEIDDVNLRVRTSTTLAAGVSIGDESLEVVATSGGGTADSFPNRRGYRVILSKGTVREEIVEVIGTDTGPDRLLIFPPALKAHLIGDDVELVADVLSIAPLDKFHFGHLKYRNRRTSYQPIGTTATTTAAAAVGDLTLPVTSTFLFPSPGNISVGGETYFTSVASATSINILTNGGLREEVPVPSTVYALESHLPKEMVEVEYDEIPVATTAGISASGGSVLLNYGTGLVTQTAAFTVAGVAGDVVLVLDDVSAFPAVFPYQLVVGQGTSVEEAALVTGTNGTTELTIGGGTYGLKNAHELGAKVTMPAPKQEKITYTSVLGSSLRFSSPIVLQSNHTPAETLIRSSGQSQPGSDGYDYPFRMPTDIRFRLQFLIDLIRALGVQVSVIEKL